MAFLPESECFTFSPSAMPQPRFTKQYIENLYDKLCLKYGSLNADRRDQKKAALNTLYLALNNNPQLTANYIGHKLLQLIEHTEPQYRSPFTTQVIERFWEKQFVVAVSAVRYKREESEEYEYIQR